MKKPDSTYCAKMFPAPAYSTYSVRKNTVSRILLRKGLFILLINFFSFISNSHTQNLVVNGNFETYTNLPNYYAQSCYATGWQSPSGSCNLVVGQGSPDYYHTLGSSGAKPPATWWSNVMPHTGNAMQGFCGYYTSGGSYREYIQYQLSVPMVPGITYQVSYYLTNGVTSFHGYGCNHIGAYFSAGPVSQTGGTPMPYIPHVQDTGIFFSTTWQLKSFLFTPASAYTYITIGNFYTNANTAITQFVSPSTVVGAYYYIDDVVVQQFIPLPVELISFTGENKNSINQLRWTTISEINSDYFEIERSRDGTLFNKTGTVSANGNSKEEMHYIFEDAGFLPGINYYRLKQVDKNGVFKLSITLAIASENNLLALWYDHDFIRIMNRTTLPVTWMMWDVSGRLIKHINIYETEFNIPSGEFTPGIYFMCLHNNRESWSGRILIN